MGKSAIVTGAAGFIGSHLVDILLENHYEVVGIDNLRTGSMKNLEDANKHKNFRFITADICDEDLKDRISHGMDIVFHLAAISSVKESMERPLEVHKVNATGTIKMLELSRDLDVGRFIFSSSAAVYGNPEILPIREDSALDPLSPYAASKIAAEYYIQAYKEAYTLDCTILRFFNVYGPRQAYSEYSGVLSIFINQALNSKTITVDGDGLQTRSLIHVHDVARALVAAGERKGAIGEVMNIAGFDEITILEIAEMIQRLLPESESEISHGPPRKGDVRHSQGDLTRIRDRLGFVPEVELDEGIKNTIRWYKNNIDS